MSNLVGPKIFLLVVPDSMPNVWLGVATTAEYATWRDGETALVMHDVRAIFVQPVGDGRRVAMSIGSPYFGDTQQETLALFPTSVEVLGEVIADETNNESCIKNQRLFQSYTDAVAKYRAALSGITLATPGDIPGNVSHLLPRK
jgi:hypothetical protein